MKAVRGWVTSKEPVSLKKATRIVSSFAARDNLASQDVTNYLKRAAVSFNELHHFHRELRRGQNPGSFWSNHVSTGDGEPSARKQDAGETQPGVGRKESSKEKKRERKPAVGDGVKVGVFSEVLDAQEPKVEGRKSIVSVEAVEVRKFAGKGRKLIMDGPVEKFVDGGDEQRSKEMRKEKRRNSDYNKLKMINREEGEEQSKKEKIKNREDGDEHSKKEKRKNREEGDEENIKKKRRRKE